MTDMDDSVFSSREVMAWPETAAFLQRLGIVVSTEQTIALKVTLGTGEGPVMVEHSYLAHRSGLSAPCPNEVEDEPASSLGLSQSKGVDEEKYKASLTGMVEQRAERQRKYQENCGKHASP